MTTCSDFRSDTVTRPTDKMRKAMAEAVVGDDVLGDDPTVQKLEALAAETMGKEAALFCPSGTMANSIAVKMWTGALEEVIVEERSHIYNMESTHMTFISGVTPRPVRSNRGVMDPEDVRAAIRKPNVHTPRTSLICLENTNNNWSGAVVPLENFQAIRKVADANEPEGAPGRRPDLQREPRLRRPGQRIRKLRRLDDVLPVQGALGPGRLDARRGQGAHRLWPPHPQGTRRRDAPGRRPGGSRDHRLDRDAAAAQGGQRKGRTAGPGHPRPSGHHHRPRHCPHEHRLLRLQTSAARPSPSSWPN